MKYKVTYHILSCNSWYWCNRYLDIDAPFNSSDLSPLHIVFPFNSPAYGFSLFNMTLLERLLMLLVR